MAPRADPSTLIEKHRFVTDGGLETVLIFHQGFDLPEFAAFDLLRDETGTEAIRSYYEPYIEIAKANDAGFILEAPTWRASRRWASRLGYSPEQLAAVNQKAIELMDEIRVAHAGDVDPILISASIGPRDDAYDPDQLQSASEAEDYHRAQLETLSGTVADMATAMTLTHVEEAIGIANAAAGVGLPVVISLTVEIDGRLPSGQPLREAIEEVDAATDRTPAYFMVNCAHPTHFAAVLEEGGAWRERIRGLRANASTRSHAELDEADELDDGDPVDLGRRHRELRRTLPGLRVAGGCCGTDHRHVAEIAAALSD
jgi:S-methylmethionine-dependent homocysteine/selenocysteine methylase